MKQQEQEQEQRVSNSMIGMVNLLRLCTVLLAAVSFWSTAQGMADYVFHESWQAYAASLAIQGILLGLNFYYPSFWHMLKSGWKKLGLFLLTVVVLCCSSWFSFIFIVEHVYGQSWDVESRLLIQSTYRRELYAANDYANEYGSLLEDELTQQIMDLYSQAKELADEEFTITDTIDWEQEKNNYTVEDFAARSEMTTIINAMESALRDGASPNEQERAIEIIIEMRNGLESSCDSLSSRIINTNANLEIANENYQAAQRSLNMATEETNRSSLITAVASAQEYLESQQALLQQLQDQLTDYQEALGRIQFYEISLGLRSEGTANLISASLRSIQLELFREQPDLGTLETQAVSVFQLLQSTIDTVGFEENADSAEGEKYQELLNQMNDFIGNLRNYSIITDAMENFNVLIDNMRNGSEALVSDNEEWKGEWSQKLDGLKSQIAGLPVYLGTEDEILLNYDRASSSDILDEMIRLYIADHNAAQQGIIYLFSPYWELALFSLVLAFFLDIAAFITGMFVETIEQRQQREGEMQSKIVLNSAGEEPAKLSEGENLSVSIPGLNTYLYLNGDYIHEEERNIYWAIKEGNEIEIDLPKMGLKAGLYTERNNIWSPIAAGQELRLISEPQDGIYIDCTIKCQEYALSIATEKDKGSYLATITEDVPAYLIKNDHLEIIPAYLLNEKKEKIIVVALNQKGTAVIAIYICDKDLSTMEE
ncbi:MAG: hypothetical protein NC392_06340 [Roseburia sp.]|nr:hypothetical protein [Roseburia sp.]MCM1202084.1 hypothetical protein [Bacteroides fragilis]